MLPDHDSISAREDARAVLEDRPVAGRAQQVEDRLRPEVTGIDDHVVVGHCGHLATRIQRVLRNGGAPEFSLISRS